MRSVVVDFEAIPFEGAAMREWRRRIQDCYGDVATGGFKAREDLVQNYQQIDSGRIESLLQSYDINFAVLYTQTQTHRPVLYQNSTFKIVALTRE